MPLNIRIKVTVPDSLFNTPKALQAIRDVMEHKTGPELKMKFDMTATTWKPRPDFIKKIESGSNYIATKVYTTDERYGYVNDGTPPHPIFPINAPRLSFQSGYTPKTKVGSLRAFPGGKFGAYVSAMSVRHPGVEAREFDQMIADEYTDTFVSDIQEAIGEGKIS